MLNILSLISFSNAVFFVFFAVYSIALNRKSLVNLASFVECSLLAVWSFSYTFFYVSETKEQAWMWLQIGSIGWIGFMGTLVWFFMALSRYHYKEHRMFRTIYCGIAPMILLILNFIFPDNSAAIDLIKSKSGLGWTYVNNISNPLYWIYIGYLLVGLVASVIILSRWLKKSKSPYFKRIATAFLIVDGVLIIIGFVSDLVLPLITDCFPPMTNVFLMIFSFSYWIIINKLDLFKVTSIEASEHILDTISDALMVTDEKGMIVHCNKSTCEMLQYPMKDIVGKELAVFIQGEAYSQEHIEQLFAEKRIKGMESDLIAKDKSIIRTSYSASIAEDDIHGFMGIIISFHDITKQKNLERELFELAHYDTLTNLPNRRYFVDMIKVLEELYREQKRDFAIHFIDLDGFKEINDTMGHDTGDVVLTEIGNKLQACILDSDFVARIGGDEFVIVQADIVSEEQAREQKEKVLALFEEPVYLNGVPARLGASIGYAFYSRANSITDLLRMADRNMYEDKINRKKKREKQNQNL